MKPQLFLLLNSNLKPLDPERHRTYGFQPQLSFSNFGGTFQLFLDSAQLIPFCSKLSAKLA